MQKFHWALTYALICVVAFLAGRISSYQSQINELGANQTSIYDRLYTLETGKPVPSNEDAQ